MIRSSRVPHHLAGAAFLALLLGLNFFVRDGAEPYRLLDGWMAPAWAASGSDGELPPAPAVGECVAGIPPGNPNEIYTINPDSTVTDGRTGLVWDRCAWGLSGDDCTGGAATEHPWADALSVAATANAQAHKGHTDWRLPNVKELHSLVERCRYLPAINDVVFTGDATGEFWSSSPGWPFEYWGNTAWYVNFGLPPDSFWDGYDHSLAGHAYMDYKTAAYRVRLVRAGQ